MFHGLKFKSHFPHEAIFQIMVNIRKVHVRIFQSKINENKVTFQWKHSNLSTHLGNLDYGYLHKRESLLAVTYRVGCLSTKGQMFLWTRNSLAVLYCCSAQKPHSFSSFLISATECWVDYSPQFITHYYHWFMQIVCLCLSACLFSPHT